jgi:hypothetical protein
MLGGGELQYFRKILLNKVFVNQRSSCIHNKKGNFRYYDYGHVIVQARETDLQADILQCVCTIRNIKHYPMTQHRTFLKTTEIIGIARFP